MVQILISVVLVSFCYISTAVSGGTDGSHPQSEIWDQILDQWDKSWVKVLLLLIAYYPVLILVHPIAYKQTKNVESADGKHIHGLHLWRIFNLTARSKCTHPLCAGRNTELWRKGDPISRQHSHGRAPSLDLCQPHTHKQVVKWSNFPHIGLQIN